MKEKVIKDKVFKLSKLRCFDGTSGNFEIECVRPNTDSHEEKRVEAAIMGHVVSDCSTRCDMIVTSLGRCDHAVI